MGLLKLLYEQPERLRLLLVNFVKLLLTVAIIQKSCNLSKLNELNDFIDSKITISLDVILLYGVTLIGVWLIVWNIGDTIFLFLMSLRKEKTDAVKDIQKQSFLPILKISGAFKMDNGAYLPGRNIQPIYELAKVLSTKPQKMTSTLFAEVLFIAIVGWFYLLFNITSLQTPCWVIITLFFCIVLLCLLYRSMNSVFEAFKDSSSVIVIFLDMMIYKDMVNNVLRNIFNAKYNSERKCYELEWKGKKYEVGDAGFKNNEHGNSRLIEVLSDPESANDRGGIIISNIVPNSTLSKIVESGKLDAYVVAKNEKEVMDNLLIALNRLDNKIVEKK